MSDNDIYKDCTVCNISMSLDKFSLQSSHSENGRNYGRKSACNDCLKIKRKEDKDKKELRNKTEVQKQLKRISR
jgi:hypothetical protein